jgi:hypothetical protein
LDGLSNVTSHRAPHERKHLEHKVSTELGIEIDDNSKQLEKLRDSIRQIWHGTSNVTAERALQ